MEIYSENVKVWIPDPNSVWKSATILQDYKEGDPYLKVKDENNDDHSIPVQKLDDLPPLRNPDILLGANDLTDLSYLNEPEVLYNLKIRFENNNLIYTYCGIVLVAINPYEELPIYGEDSIYAYRGADLTSLNPHIFAMAEHAFKEMERENRDQSLIVSGESGAGKTVSAKYAMRYFAMVAGSSSITGCSTKLESHVEEKVLASNPIMEAIGNAKTTRNDNSSRFGKFIEIDFTKEFKMMGANMRTYLLEKSRVVYQSPQERNYHIFYQLCAARNNPEFSHMELMHQDNFMYTCGGECPEIENIDDLKEFETTRNAFKLLDFSSALQMELFSILAAVLHLGNIQIVEATINNTDACKIEDVDSHIRIVANLMGVDASKLAHWLCNRSVLSGRDTIVTPLNKSQAVAAKNALAKHIYAQLFDWIVKYINKSLATSEKPYRFIGVLDIYGFETFEVNSFEQFCINYANEKLQQQFNLHVFKLEQEEYRKEEINWEYINFFDNQPCIDLIESKLGILDLLDEECRLPRGSDDNWCKKLHEKCCHSKHFEKPKFFDQSFIVCHFADTVKYLTVGFLDKNKDTVLEEQINILRCSELNLLKQIFTDEPRKIKLKVTPDSAAVSSKKHKKTVGTQFRESLSLLMETLNKTTPSYIRCIKPNDLKASFEFDSSRAIQQLRACGVLETVRISAAGFPTRWTYAQFLARYRVLVKSNQVNRHEPKITCQTIVQDIMKPDKYQFGRTKVFFRSGQLAYMEKIRSDKLRRCAIMITKHVKSWIFRTRYKKVKHAVLMIQCYARGLRARQYARRVRETRAAVTIQKNVKMYLNRSKYLTIRHSVIIIQKYSRRWLAQKLANRMIRDRKAAIIQKNVRCWQARKKYRHTLKAIVTIQSFYRGMMARRAAKPLREERKQSNYLKEENRRIREHSEYLNKLNKGLENKIIQLQQRLDEQISINRNLENIEKDYKNMQQQVMKSRKLEMDMKDILNKRDLLEQQVNKYKENLEKERAEKMDIIMEKELLAKSSHEQILKFHEENKSLKDDLNELMKRHALTESEAVELSKCLHEKEKVIQDSDEDRGQYQKLLAEKNHLEMLVDELQDKIRKQGSLSKGHRRLPSDVSNYSEATTDIIRDDASDFSALTADYTSMNDEDLGYSSTRRGPCVDKKDLQAWLHRSEATENEDKVADMQLVLKLQQRLRESEKEKLELRRKLDRIEHRSTSSPDIDQVEEDFNMIRLQEAELELEKLRRELRELQESVAGETGQQTLISQFDNMREEVEKRREEAIQLRSSMNKKTTKSQVNNYYDKHDFENAFSAQKDINRQLEMELQTEKDSKMKLREELDKLKEENERQMKALTHQFLDSSKTEAEQRFQLIYTKLSSENLELTERCAMLEEQNRKLKQQLKKFFKQIKESQAVESRREIMVNQYDNKDMPAVKLKKHDYMGMFEYPDGREDDVVRGLILELKPKIARELMPGLAAYIFFMCIRFTDHINDDSKIRNLLSTGIFAIKKVVKKKHYDMETMILWLANTCRLLHIFKQYSDEEQFKTENTPKQNEQCLRNFDLSEYRQVLSDIAVWIYQGVIKILEEKIHPMIVPAILENEGASMMSGQESLPLRSRSQSSPTDPNSPDKKEENALSLLLCELNTFLEVFYKFGLDPQLISQMIRQMYYFICAASLNNLFLRKNLCRWSKGINIRFNISCLEQWCRDNKIRDPDTILNTLKPIIEASQLLQARKTKNDIENICDLCTKLTPLQAIKILSLYTPSYDYEDTIPDGFVKEVKAYLDKKAGNTLSSKELLMDTKFAFSIRFPFNPSKIQLESIEIPSSLHLPMLKKM